MPRCHKWTVLRLIRRFLPCLKHEVPGVERGGGCFTDVFFESLKSSAVHCTCRHCDKHLLQEVRSYWQHERPETTQTQVKTKLTKSYSLQPVHITTEIVQGISTVSGSHLLGTGGDTVEKGPKPLNGFELGLCKPSKVSWGEQRLALLDVSFQMESGDDEVYVDEGLRQMKALRHGGDPRPEVDAPLASDVVGRDEGEDGDAEDAGEKDVVHISVPRIRTIG